MTQLSLNGWQRLWIALGVLYAFIVAITAWTEFPTDLSINEYLGVSDAEYGHIVPVSPARYVFSEDRWLRVEESARNPDTNECIYLRDGEWSDAKKCDSLKYEKLPRTHTEDEAEILREKQAKYIGTAVMWWVIPLAVVYILGVGVAWVISGFRNRGTSQP